MAENDTNRPINIYMGGSFLWRYWIYILAISVPFLGYLISSAWVEFGPVRQELDGNRRAWVDQAAKFIIQDLASFKNDPSKNKGTELRQFTLSYFSGDQTGIITTSIRTKAFEDAFDFVPKSFMEKVWDKLNLPLSDRQPFSQEQAKSLGANAKHRNADAALWGVCRKLEKIDNKVIGEIDYYLIDTEGAILYKNTCNNEALESSNPSLIDIFSDSTIIPSSVKIPNSFGHRILGWILLVLLFPIVSITFLQSMVSKKSNRVNAFVLIVYTSIDGILLYTFFQPNYENITHLVIFLATIIIAGMYNLLIMDFARKLEE